MRQIEETRALIGSLILTSGDSKYQQLLDTRQLARPTFKLIQDLVKSLVVETRVLRDLFNAQDFEPKLVKDRQLRLKFIQRLIEFAAQNEQPVVGCVAAKILTGQETGKTLELLRALAKIAQSRLAERSQQKPATFVRAPKAPPSRSARPKPANSRPSSSSLGPREPAERSVEARKIVVEPVRRTPKRQDVQEQAGAPVVSPALVSQPTVTAPSELDIERNIQLLRTNLKTLRSLSLELARARQELSEIISH